MTRRLPWLGLGLAALGWAFAHQAGSDSLFDDCRHGTPAFILLICLAGLVVAIAGGLWSLAVWRGAAGSKGRLFLGMLGMLLAGFTSFAIILSALSGLIIPSCFG
jgi:hypothetical protein